MATRTQTPTEAFQLVGRGETRNNVFNDQDVNRLIDSCDAPKDPYTVFSIIGPQSGGKSTLLNAVFNTKFGVMDASKGRGQTTQGIWAAICNSSRAVVLDIEGTDSGELLQNDLGFENRSALFALVVSDVIFINMWLHDIGLVRGIPLLTNIFQERAKKAGPNELPEQHKTIILFAVRDYDGVTPKELLEGKITKMVDEIWKSIPQSEDSRLDKYFELQVELFPHFRLEKDKFYNKCAEMRERIEHGDLVHRRLHGLPVRDFPSDAKELWEKVVKNKTLDIPSQREIRARSSCHTIMSEHFENFKSKEPLERKESPREFDHQFTEIIDNIISQYVNETQVYGIDIAHEMKQILKTKILQHAETTFRSILAKFKTEIVEKTTHEIQQSYRGGIEQHVKSVVHKYSHKFENEIKGLNYYSDQTDQEGFLRKLNDLGTTLTADIKKINNRNIGLSIATGVLASTAVATVGIGGLAAAGGYMIAAYASGLLATGVTGAAVGTGTALGKCRKDFKHSVNETVSKFAEEINDEKSNKRASSSSSK